MVTKRVKHYVYPDKIFIARANRRLGRKGTYFETKILQAAQSSSWILLFEKRYEVIMISSYNKHMKHILRGGFLLS